MKQAFFGSKSTSFWTFAILLMWLLLIFGDDLRKYYDEHLLPRPWIAAEIQVIPADVGKPLVQYKAHAHTEVSGTWAAWVQPIVDGNPVRGCGGSGNGNYRPNNKVAKLWGWSDFLGADCQVPSGPYQLCARYAVRTESGAYDIFGPDCSPIVNQQKEP